MNQAALTGEALPVEKKAAPTSPDVLNPLDLPNICFLGSNVESGSATAVVIPHREPDLLWVRISSGRSDACKRRVKSFTI